MTTIIRVIAHTHPDADPLPQPCYLAAYKPEAEGGRGWVAFTADRDEAWRYPTFEAAYESWRAQPRNHPVRATDGKPNRPLTAYSVLFEDYDKPDPLDGHPDEAAAILNTVTKAHLQ